MKKNIKLFTLFLISVFNTFFGQTQTNVLKDNITSATKDIVTSNGPNIMVRNLKKDRNGNILIAGSNASVVSDVFRYDGKSFTNLTSNVGQHNFWDVLEDRSGNIWFTSLDSGVYYYNPRRAVGKSFQHFTTGEGLPNNQVMSIYEDRAGIIWLGTGGGLSRYDGKSFQNFTTKEGLSNNEIHIILEDKSGKLWIGTRGEVCYFNGKNFTVLTNEDGKTFNNVWSIIEDKKGNIWLGTDADGLWRYDGRIFTKVSQRGVYAITEDKQGNIWTTGEVEFNGQVWSLSRYDQKSLYKEKPNVTEIMSREPALLAIMEANDGSIWFGANDGVYRYDGKTIIDFKIKEGQK